MSLLFYPPNLLYICKQLFLLPKLNMFDLTLFGGRRKMIISMKYLLYLKKGKLLFDSKILMNKSSIVKFQRRDAKTLYRK